MATEKKWQNHKNNLCAKVCRWRIHANMFFPQFCTLKNLFLHNKRLYFALVFSVLPDNYFGNKVHQSSRKPCQQKKNVSRKRRSFRLFRNKKKGKYVVAKDLTRETATEKMLAKPQKWFAHKIFVLRECTHTRPSQHSAFFWTWKELGVGKWFWKGTNHQWSWNPQEKEQKCHQLKKKHLKATGQQRGENLDLCSKFSKNCFSYFSVKQILCEKISVWKNVASKTFCRFLPFKTQMKSLARCRKSMKVLKTKKTKWSFFLVS